jgi:hypothetical protein
MYAGRKEHDVTVLRRLLFSGPPQQDARVLFARGIREYPGRYLAGVLRTWALYPGATGVQSENRIFRNALLHEDPNFPRGGNERSTEQAAIWEEMKGPVRNSSLMGMYRGLSGPFETVTVVTSVLFFVTFLVALTESQYRLVAEMTLPFSFLTVSSLMMASIDRYGFPAQPWIMAFGFTAPVLACHSLRSRLVRMVREIRGEQR